MPLSRLDNSAPLGGAAGFVNCSSSSSPLFAWAKSLLLIWPETATYSACTRALSGPASAALMSAVMALSRLAVSAPSVGGGYADALGAEGADGEGAAAASPS